MIRKRIKELLADTWVMVEHDERVDGWILGVSCPIGFVEVHVGAHWHSYERGAQFVLDLVEKVRP